MQVSIRAPRTFSEEWSRAYEIPCDKLPSLTPEEKESAQILHMSEEEYARNRLATGWSAEKQLARTAQVGRFLEQKLRGIDRHARIEEVILDTLSGKYELQVSVNGVQVPATIQENIVDDLLEAGSLDAEQRIARILELTVRTRGE